MINNIDNTDNTATYLPDDIYGCILKYVKNPLKFSIVSSDFNRIFRKFINPTVEQISKAFAYDHIYSHVTLDSIINNAKITTKMYDEAHAFLSATLNGASTYANILYFEKGVDPTIPNNEAIYCCANRGMYRLLNALLKDKRVIEKGFKMNQLMFDVARGGHVPMYKLLTKHKYFDSSFIEYSLICAARSGQYQMVKYLIEKDPNPEQASDYLCAAVAGRNKDVITLIFDTFYKCVRTASIEYFVPAIIDCDIETIKFLLKLPYMKIDESNYDTIVYYTILQNDTELNNLILNHKSIATLTNNNLQYHVIECLGRFMRDEIVKFLLHPKIEIVKSKVIERLLCSSNYDYAINIVTDIIEKGVLPFNYILKQLDVACEYISNIVHTLIKCEKYDLASYNNKLLYKCVSYDCHNIVKKLLRIKKIRNTCDKVKLVKIIAQNNSHDVLRLLLRNKVRKTFKIDFTVCNNLLIKSIIKLDCHSVLDKLIKVCPETKTIISNRKFLEKYVTYFDCSTLAVLFNNIEELPFDLKILMKIVKNGECHEAEMVYNHLKGKLYDPKYKLIICACRYNPIFIKILINNAYNIYDLKKIMSYTKHIILSEYSYYIKHLLKEKLMN